MKFMNIDIDIHSLLPQDFAAYKLIDSREQKEIDECPPLTKCQHIPFSKFPGNKTQFSINDRYLIFCAKGGRSHRMAEILAKDGVQALSVNNGIASVNAYLKKILHADHP